MELFKLFLFLNGFFSVFSLSTNFTSLALDYFFYKNIKFVCYLSCESKYENKIFTNEFLKNNIRVAVEDIEQNQISLDDFLYQQIVPIGVVLDLSCGIADHVLLEASRNNLFDAMHIWLVLAGNSSIEDNFTPLNLSMDADVLVAHAEECQYRLTDVFNYGKIQGNKLEMHSLGVWVKDSGLNIDPRSKYYRRWDFHNLTLRAISVIVEKPKVIRPEILTDVGYTVGVAAMTKVVAQLLSVLMEQHNFRLNYTIAGRWIGAPERNSTLAVTNSLFWREQDISCTCARIYPKWMEWVDIFFPPASMLETKFYYLIPDKGVGDYENRFLTPMSPGVWWCSCGALLVCALVLAVAAKMEGRPKPGIYAIFSVLAALCQQAYEDGVQLLEEKFSSQGRRATLLVVGLTSMLLYNYYTSSVVSWLLNAAVPSIESLDELKNSDLELVFENIGYAKQWLDNPGFYYFAGYKNVKEDELREAKVTRAKRTTGLLQPVGVGMEMIKHGPYAFHTEPYTASQVIARTFEDRDLCALGSLQMMPPSQVYIMGQKHSPYGKFFIWSMMRLLERGHIKASRERVGGKMPACSGRTPRALALGQAAPAFALLAQLALLSTLILLVEIFLHRSTLRDRR